MNERARRRVVLLLLAAAIPVLAIAGIEAIPAAIDAWHIRRLDSPDRAVRREAIVRLGERRSTRAVPRLVKLYEDEDDIHLRFDIIDALLRIDRLDLLEDRVRGAR
jgi:HEAT repeat protein